MFYRTILKMFFLPPVLNIVLVVAGLLLMRRHPRLGLASCLVGVVSLYVLSLWPVANGLLKTVEVAPALNASQLEALSSSNERLAIVVLGAGHREISSEYGIAWPDKSATVRLNYAAHLHKQLDLPVLLTGGKTYHASASADVMASYLKTLFAIDVAWVEPRSRTTRENAEYTRQILAAEGIDTVVLVTQSVHMRRSIMLFEQVGFTVVPAPTELAEPAPFWRGSLLPRVDFLMTSTMAMHEWLGYIYYRLQGF